MKEEWNASAPRKAVRPSRDAERLRKVRDAIAVSSKAVSRMSVRFGGGWDGLSRCFRALSTRSQCGLALCPAGNAPLTTQRGQPSRTDY